MAAGIDGPGQVTVWDTSGWTSFTIDAQVGSEIHTVLFCDQDRRIAIAGDAGIRLLDFSGDADGPIQDVDANDETLLSSEQSSGLVGNQSGLLWASRDSSNDLSLLSREFFFYSFDADQPVKQLDWKGSTYYRHPSYASLPEKGFLFFDDQQILQLDHEGTQLGKPIENGSHWFKASPTSNWIAVAQPTHLEIWDRQSGELWFKIPLQMKTIASRIEWNPVKNQIAIAYKSGFVDLWDLDQVQAELTNLGL